MDMVCIVCRTRNSASLGHCWLCNSILVASEVTALPMCMGKPLHKRTDGEENPGQSNAIRCLEEDR